MKNRSSGAIYILIALIAIAAFILGGHAAASMMAFVGKLAKTLLFVGIGGVALITALFALGLSLSNKKKEDSSDKAEENADPLSPEGIKASIRKYKVSPHLGQIARTALNQIKQMEEQKVKYAAVLNSRFTEGSFTYNKYLALQNDFSDAMFNEYQRIASRMLAFDEKEYGYLKTSQYKYDSIPNDVQESRLESLENSLKEMQECLAKNERAIYDLDQLMILLADSNYTESSFQEQIENLSEQLEYYKQQEMK